MRAMAARASVSLPGAASWTENGPAPAADAADCAGGGEAAADWLADELGGTRLRGGAPGAGEPAPEPGVAPSAFLA